MEHTWAKIKSWVNTQLAGKANLSHTHTYSQITDLGLWKTAIFGKGTYLNNGAFSLSGNLIVADNSIEVDFADVSNFVRFSAADQYDNFVLTGIISSVRFDFTTLGSTSAYINKPHGFCLTSEVSTNTFRIVNRSDANIKVTYIVAGKIGSISVESSGNETIQIGSTNEAVLIFW